MYIRKHLTLEFSLKSIYSMLFKFARRVLQVTCQASHTLVMSVGRTIKTCGQVMSFVLVVKLVRLCV
jgi:hypothetical protein